MLIEPVAIRLNFWQWQNNVIPKQNYFGWYIIGFLQLAVFTYFLPNVKNKIGVVMLLIQFLFFALIISFLGLWA
jgi:putative membrane protein